MLLPSPASRNRLAATALACGLCLGAAAPYALAANQPAAPVAGNGTVFDWKTGTGDTQRDNLLGQVLAGGGSSAIVIVTPGTDDTGLHPRIDGIVGSRDAAYIRYPESFFPFLSGKADTPLGLPIFAPTYRASSAVATQQNLTVMELLKDHGGIVVYTGYSQGADALGNAAEQASQNGWLGTNTLILLVSDPRSPWGIKGWARDLPLSNVLVSPALGLLGIDNNGARDPGASGDVQVISVIVQGDPVADWQWNWLRPGSSLLVNLAGFVAIHSPGDGPYGNLDKLGDPTMLHSADGKTAYAVYDTYHPLALLNAMIYDAVGLKYTEADLKRWDRQADVFYPMTDIVNKKPSGGIEIEAGNGGLQPIGHDSIDAIGAATADVAPLTERQKVADRGTADHRLRDGNGDWADAGEGWSGKPSRHEKKDVPVEESTDAITPSVTTPSSTAPDSTAPDSTAPDSTAPGSTASDVLTGVATDSGAGLDER